jgi:hypothetical protein
MICTNRHVAAAIFIALIPACSPSAPQADAPQAPESQTATPSAPGPQSAAPDVPALVAALADSPLPGEWSLIRGQGVVMARYVAPGSSDFIAAVACAQQMRHVEFMFAPPSRSPGRAPGDTRLLTLTVIAPTEKLSLNAKDWSESSGRHEVRAEIEGSIPLAIAKPQERIAFETDYFGTDIKLVFPWHESIATVLKECGG